MTPQDPASIIASTPYPPASASQPVLEYQRQLKIWARGGRGLLWLSIAVAATSCIYSILALFLMFMLPGSSVTFDDLKYLPLFTLPFLWGVTYMTVAILFRRRVRWAGWVALSMTVVNFLGWMIVVIYGTNKLFREMEVTPLLTKYLLAFTLLAISVSLAAVAVEILQAMRARLAWSAPPPE